MITKGIVEEIIDPYNIRVRIPILDRVNSSGFYTPTDQLNVASICTLPNCDVNLAPGDIVFVSIEDRHEDIVILGYLYRTKATESLCNLMLDTLVVESVAQLPNNTTIGDVSATDISCLSGIRDNIQSQLDNIVEQINNLKGGT